VRARRRWLWLVAPLLLGLGAYFVWPVRAGSPSRGVTSGAGPALPVVVATARSGAIGVYYTGLGTVTPLATVTVRSRVDGQVTSVRYREGETVQKGDLLVEIDDGPYQAALTQAEGQLIRDEATLENARIDLARYQQLVPLKAVPEQQLATQEATVHQSEGIVKFDQGQIDSARVNLAYTRITAPVSGRVGLRLVDPGNIVHAADTNGLVVITQMDPISVIFTISAAGRAWKGGRPADARSGCLRPRGQDEACARHAVDARQSGRSGDRDAEAQSDVREHEGCALPQSVRERPAAGRGKARRHAGADCRGATELGGNLRLHRKGGFNGDRAADHRWHDGGRRL
jgi:multidrug efflux pump subunit AcrA (membrane-fusion protein)